MKLIYTNNVFKKSEGISHLEYRKIKLYSKNLNPSELYINVKSSLKPTRKLLFLDFLSVTVFWIRDMKIHFLFLCWL
jgi:hypothetical protein